MEFKFKPLSCVCGCFTIPQRYICAIVMMFGLFYCYTHRVVLNLAITEIVARNVSNSSGSSDADHEVACPDLEPEDLEEEMKGGTYEWSEKQVGWAKGIFYGGYLISHVPMGLLADKLGGRWVLFFSVGTSALTTLVSPLCIQFGGFWVFLVIRFITGLAQGGIYPCFTSMLNQWAPLKDRGGLSAIVYIGQHLGTVIGNIGTGQMIGIAGDWTLPFYVWGILSLVWCAVSLVTVFSTPETHPFLTEKEVQYLQENIVKHKLPSKIPWKEMWMTPVIYCLISAQIGHDYIVFSLITDLPKYMKDILRFNVKKNGVVSALPFIALFISCLSSGYLSDYVMKKNWISVINLRRLQTIVSAMGPATCILLAGYVGCNRAPAVVLFVFGTFLMGPFFCGTKISANDVSVHFGGIVMAIMNGIGAAAGLLSPVIVSLFVTRGALSQWRTVFWLIWGFALLTTIHYVIFIKSDREKWDYVEDEE